MDTREKIRNWEALRQEISSGKWTIVAGFFDPLTAEQAERIHALAESERRLLIVVQPGEPCLLEQRARATLMAGLRSVTAVLVEAGEEWRSLAKANPNIRVVEDAMEEQKRRERFEQSILDRQAAQDRQA